MGPAEEGPDRRALRPRGRLRRHDLLDVPEGRYRAVPRAEGPHGAPVSRTPPAQPVRRRLGALHRLRAVRLGVPGGRDPRRGRPQHPRPPGLAGGALRPGVPDQLSALHLLRILHPGLPDAGVDDDQRVRARRPHPRRPHLRETPAARPFAGRDAGRAPSDGRGHLGRRLLPRRGRRPHPRADRVGGRAPPRRSDPPDRPPGRSPRVGAGRGREPSERADGRGDRELAAARTERRQR